MKHWTEQAIRADLDGTFTKIDPNGRSETVEVDLDFIPTISGGNGGRSKGQKVLKQAYWTPAEEDLLARMRLLNKTFGEIGWVLARSEDAVKKHFKMMRVRGLVP